ncbi:hypothetical protein V8J88_01375 [Massilia sp. W12]|uniref:lipase family protein n=1 Tax=Massilia sp. W12 TaxID=3126507 RepID=UPI0030D1CBAA
MADTYDLAQTVELLNFAANGASSISATQSQLQGYLQTYLNGGTTPINTPFAGFFPQMNSQLAGGDWRVVWGPVVYSTKPDSEAEAANAMYVAYSANLAMYVVAIAATNPASIYDWVAEDGDVSPLRMAEWPPSLPFSVSTHLPPLGFKPYISAATARGLSNLLTQMSDPANQGTLQSFLKSKTDANATLVFTGHSLAGALSPTLALYLYPDPPSSGWKNVFVLPTAGASPGNAKFAQLFVSAYPQTAIEGVNQPYGFWNVDFANQNDVVPHAWNQLSNVVQPQDEAGNYPSFFGVLSQAIGSKLRDAVIAAEALSGGSLEYQNLTQSVFAPQWGTWQNTWDATTQQYQYPAEWVSFPVYTDQNPLSTVEELGAALEATHISQYFRFFNMAPPPKMATKQPQAQDGAMSLQKRLLLAAAAISHA